MLTIIVIGAVVGFLAGGPLGMLIGGGIGWWLGGRLRGGLMLSKGLAEMQRQFMDSTFAVMGAVCQADGQVSGEERQVLEQLLVRLRLPESTRARARAAFERGEALVVFDVPCGLGSEEAQETLSQVEDLTLHWGLHRISGPGDGCPGQCRPIWQMSISAVGANR